MSITAMLAAAAQVPSIPWDADQTTLLDSIK